MKYLKYISICFVALLLSSERVTAQVKSLIGPSKIHYKDGSVFRGEILELNQDRIMFLLSTDTVTLFHDKVKKFVSLNQKGNSGFFFNGNTGISPFTYTVQAEVIVAKRLSRHWAVGAMGGFYIFRKNNDSRDFGPPPGFQYPTLIEHDFVNLSGYGRFTMGKQVKWFLDGKVGYGMKGPKQSPTYDHGYHRKGGVAFQPGIGTSVPLHNNLRMTFSVNQSFQYTRAERDNPNTWGVEKYSFWFSRTLLKIGLEFG